MTDVACVASVSVWFRSKERPRKGTFGFACYAGYDRLMLWVICLKTNNINISYKIPGVLSILKPPGCSGKTSSKK